MGRLSSCGWFRSSAPVLLVLAFAGCGGHKPPGQSVLPARVTLTPATSASLALGNILSFSATAQNNTGSTIPETFTFSSSDTTILNISPGGVACAGKWDITYTNCTPEGIGVVQVTASALGATSAPTYVFVHATIDNITVTESSSTSQPPPPGPCFPENQNITLQATAFSQGIDITPTVGTFTWTATNSSVVGITPIKNLNFEVPTNLALATANVPGLTQIFASVSGVTSTAFQQITPSPNIVWDFFETCPIQNIRLQLGPGGSQQSGQTSFAVTKGTAENVTAIVTDVLGNELSRAPLTWSTTQPGAVSVPVSCAQETCALGTGTSGGGPGAATVTASCSPPTCNVGYPLSPPGLATYPQYIPVPVYATTAISGLVTGTPATTSVLAGTLGCAADFLCNVAIYDVSTSSSKAFSGNPTSMPVPPESMLFDPAGDKAFIGSTYGAAFITPANIGTSNPIFGELGTVTGNILAISSNSNFEIFSDTIHTPNQVYVVNTTNSTSPTSISLPISGATKAAFSPDGLKAYIFGFDSNGNPNIFIYSAVLGLETIPLPAQTTVNAIGFSPNSAFAYVVGSVPGAGASFTIYNTCNDSVSTPPAPVTLPTPTFVRFLPNVQLNGLDSQGNSFPNGAHIILLDTTGLEIVTQQSASPQVGTVTTPGTLCPQTTTSLTAQRVNLSEGVLDPVNFFTSPDGTQVFIVASNFNSILVYSFNSGAVTGIPMAKNATPVTADITVDGTLIYVAGSDGMLHTISTASGVDLLQIPFANLSTFPNPFCTLDPSPSQPCTLNLVAVKP
jgi:hypothetical protein